MKRYEGGRGMISIEDCVNVETKSLNKSCKLSGKDAESVFKEEVLKVKDLTFERAYSIVPR